jgi:lipid-A-disaccharide synthase
MTPPRIALVAGEASGDLLASLVLPELRRRVPQAECAGIAGDGMIAAGCEPWHHVRELSVRGYAEVLRHLPRLLLLRRRLIARLLAWPASVYVGVDAPDFNLGVAYRLREQGVPTVQFVSVQRTSASPTTEVVTAPAWFAPRLALFTAMSPVPTLVKRL